ncbi:hypothetical protein EVAR_34390_1 [Eumeta japonica]|uniref:Uncharacterized protein n=1 Tax=Eumeta variegata TaxID=151549 RepID=A0A4C1WVK4_EUMVA|nr:hypothetical protein EVAR_34390_1 [Eumeta japonica]
MLARKDKCVVQIPGFIKLDHEGVIERHVYNVDVYDVMRIFHLSEFTHLERPRRRRRPSRHVSEFKFAPTRCRLCRGTTLEPLKLPPL